MDSHEMTLQNPQSEEAGRVVEFELHLPRRQEIALPKVNAEPLRRAAEDVVLTGIGLTLLAGRALVNTMRAAHRAGEEAAEHPGPVTRALIGLVSKKAKPADKPLSHHIPVLPIAGYSVLGSDEIIARLEGLSQEQLVLVRDYEAAHLQRAAVLEALAARLTSA
jgi:hypothetical protein